MKMLDTWVGSPACSAAYASVNQWAAITQEDASPLLLLWTMSARRRLYWQLQPARRKVQGCACGRWLSCGLGRRHPLGSSCTRRASATVCDGHDVSQSCHRTMYACNVAYPFFGLQLCSVASNELTMVMQSAH